MIIVAGHVLVNASDRDRYVADCAVAVERGRAAEGCLDFAISTDVLDPRRVNVYERWRDREELEVFRGDGPGDDLLARIVSLNVAEYEVV